MSRTTSATLSGHRVRSAALLAGLLSLLSTSAAQTQHPIVGTWRVEFPRGVEMTNGEERVTEWGHARAVFSLHGDSVIGQWTSTDSSATPAKVRRVAGTYSGNKLHLVSEPIEATMNGPDGESKIKLIVIYDLEVTGDTLAGTQSRKVMDSDGMPEGSALPVKGAREKK